MYASVKCKCAAMLSAPGQIAKGTVKGASALGDAVKGALKKLRKVLVAQDQKKQERLQMEILEGTDSAKNKAEAKAKRKEEAEYARLKHEQSYDRIFEHTDQVGYFVLQRRCKRPVAVPRRDTQCMY